MANTEYNYNLLAKAVVTDAAEEYKRNRFILDTLALRKYENSENMEKARQAALREIADVERFFRSEWFETLSDGVNGHKALKALSETYFNEYLPMRLEEMKKKGIINGGKQTI